MKEGCTRNKTTYVDISSYVLPSYQTGRIKTPIAVFCGGRDTLPNNLELIASLPKEQCVAVHMVDKYEHLDFMWAKDVATVLYPKILALLDKYNPTEDPCCEL